MYLPVQDEREYPLELVKSQINNLFSELIPAITQFCRSVSIPKIVELLGERFKRPTNMYFTAVGVDAWD
jgi:hypothetical protein